jgi:hypothetical protein
MRPPRSGEILFQVHHGGAHGGGELKQDDHPLGVAAARNTLHSEPDGIRDM